MTSGKEISSTEKLLDVIRKDKTPAEFLRTPVSHPSRKSGKFSFLKIPRRNKTISVGIDIGYHQLKLVKVARSPDNQWKLLSYSTVFFGTDAPKGSAEFADFLKSELDKFCGGADGFNLWAMMSSADVEVTHIKIPKVAKKQIENAVRWTAKKNISFSEKEHLFDFEIQGEVIESGVTKLAAMVYASPKKDVQEMRDLFESIGYPLSGLTIAPFAIQNLFKTNWIPAIDKTLSTLYIGRGWSRIDIFSNGNLVMTRGIRAGINSMVQELMEGYNKSAGITPPQGSQPEQSSGFTDAAENIYMNMEDAGKLLFGLSPDSPSTKEVRARFHLEEDSILDKINPALERLVRQIERTFQHYTLTLGNERINSIYVSTSMNVYRPIVDYISDQLGIEEYIPDPLQPENPFVGGITSGVSVSDRISFMPVLGVALSDSSRTPNLILSHKDKERQTKTSKINRAIFSALLIVLIACAGFLLWFDHLADRKKAMITQLEQQLNQGIQVDEKVVSQVAYKVEQKQNRLREYSKRYMGMAVISELSVLTPSNIRLLHISAEMGMASSPVGKNKGGVTTIEGIVSGDVKSLEASLAVYVLKLQSSPMFSQIKINTSNIQHSGNVDMLHFKLNARFAGNIT